MMTRTGAAWRGAAIGALGVFVLGAFGHCFGLFVSCFFDGDPWWFTRVGELAPFAVIGAITGVGDYDARKAG